jgi:hypothetical protein
LISKAKSLKRSGGAFQAPALHIRLIPQHGRAMQVKQKITGERKTIGFEAAPQEA